MPFRFLMGLSLDDRKAGEQTKFLVKGVRPPILPGLSKRPLAVLEIQFNFIHKIQVVSKTVMMILIFSFKPVGRHAKKINYFIFDRFSYLTEVSKMRQYRISPFLLVNLTFPLGFP